MQVVISITACEAISVVEVQLGISSNLMMHFFKVVGSPLVSEH